MSSVIIHNMAPKSPFLLLHIRQKPKCKWLLLTACWIDYHRSFSRETAAITIRSGNTWDRTPTQRATCEPLIPADNDFYRYEILNINYG